MTDEEIQKLAEAIKRISLPEYNIYTDDKVVVNGGRQAVIKMIKKHFLFIVLVAFLCLVLAAKTWAHLPNVITQDDVRKVRVNCDTTCYYFRHKFSCVKDEE